MSFKFITRPLDRGNYEPEGIYLGSPVDGTWPVVQSWGDHGAYYSQYRYNGIPLKGYMGMLFHVAPGTTVRAVDNGRVVAISVESGGFERYIKIEHRWGESLLALLGDVDLDSGQTVSRSQPIAWARRDVPPIYVHFGIRVTPYNRFDGWGGFTDPLPYMDPEWLPASDAEWADSEGQPVPLLQESPGLRRP